MDTFTRCYAAFARTTFRTFLMVAIMAVASLALAGRPAAAADGDQLRQITADRGPAGSCEINTGLAFDGTNLLLSCWFDSKIVAVSPADGHFVAMHTITGVAGMGALAWDNGRHLLWACQLHSSVGTVNLVTNTFTPRFTSAGCTDGLAYDGSDDTIWSGADVSSTIQHYTSAGVLIKSFSDTGKIGNCGKSGIAVGGNVLYVANNGCSQIYRVAKDFSSSTLFATFPRRLEDMECDDLTFAAQGKAAMWSLDAYDTVLNAWQIPLGSCSFGGGTQPTPPPTTTTHPLVAATSPACGQAVISATGVTPGLPHQIVVTSSAGGTAFIANVTADASQKVSATVDLKSAFGGSGGGTFTALVRMTSNQVIVSNTATFTAAACPTPTPAPRTPTPATPAPTPTPTPAPIAQLPSTATGGDGGLPISALAAMAIALGAFAWRKREPRT